MNLAQLAEQSAERLGERRSLIFEGTVHTNLQTLDRARRLHRALADRGVGAGDVVALCMINHASVYPTFQGIFRSGAAAAPVMFQVAVPELRFILEDTRACGVITDLHDLEKVRRAVDGLAHVEWIAVLGGRSRRSAQPPEVALESWLEGDPETRLPAIDPGQLALLLYTSGTTGKPKGAMLSHANLIASAEAAYEAAEVDGLESPRISVSAMPMAHIFGVGVMNSGYLLPKRLADGYMVQMTRFEPERFMQLIHEHRANQIPAVPTMLTMVLSHPKLRRYDLSSLEEVVCGAAPLPVELAKAFAKRFGCRVREIYGMTESTGLGSANRRSDEYRPGSAGRAYLKTEVAIFDADDQPVEPGERGEIVLRGPSIMKGYLNRPEETAETLRGGWLHTGDVGYLDEEGFLYIVDRKKDMILRGGENIYPAEIESVLYEHPAVAEAAVVGAPDEVYGERVVAFVALRPDQMASPDELIEFVKQRITPFKAPSEIHPVDALPKSGVGKILRRELRVLAAGQKEIGAAS
ncbi:MAG TPA: AMP-binding protein [Thermoanaerobaculia bacterium]|nr:AMP-binding protein [Thermoanaerobaculia bacterium]